MPDKDPPEGANESSIPGDGEKPAQKNVVIIPLEAVQRAAEQGQPLTLTIETATAHSGPLPSPNLLREYESVYPGLPKIIVDQFQIEGNHRRRLQLVGQLGALGIALASILAGAILTYLLGTPWAAVAVIAPVCGTVGTAQLLEYWFKNQ